MKTSKYLVAVCAVVLFFGCQKNELDQQDTPQQVNGVVTLKAYSDESIITKSDYTLSSDETQYEFKWVLGDKFVAQTLNGTTYGSDVFEASEGGSSKADFTGSFSSGDQATYAFYPNDGTDGTYNFIYKNVAIDPIAPSTEDYYNKGATATITLPTNIVEDKDHPWSHIPMIGVKDANGDYSFKPITGVIKFTVKDLPSTATKVRIKTNSGYKKFSGDFVFDTANEVRLNYGTSNTTAWGDLILEITSAGSTTDRTFYFPVPTGTLSAGAYDFYVENNDNWWRQGSPKVDLTVVKGQVLELPPLTFHETRIVSVTGTVTAPAIHMDFPTGERLYCSFEETADATPSSYPMTFSKANDNWVVTSTYLPSHSGTWYLHYKIVNNSNQDIVYQTGSIELYYLGNLNVSVAGTSSAPKINVSSITGYDIRAILTTLSQADAIAKLDASRNTPDADVLEITSVGEIVLPTTSLSTGEYSLYLRGYNDTHDVQKDTKYTVYFLSAEDKTTLEGNYTHTVGASCVQGHPGADAPTTSNFTLAESTDPTLGHMMVTNFDGMSCVQKVPGIYTPSTNKIVWDNYNTSFDPDNNYKRFVRSSGVTTKLGFVFDTSKSPVEFYADAGFGYKTGTADSGGWQYYYYAGNSHLYTKQ